MRLSRRSYPHPVVGNLDDVPGAAFQATVEMSADKDNIYLDVNIQNSSVTIRHLVETARAAYAVHVECTNTLFRRAFEFREESKRIAIPSDQLNDAVEVNVFAVARQDASGYLVDKAHPDYEGSAFDVKKGDILAVGEGRVFVVESSFDVLGRIGSIMQIDVATKQGDLPMEVDFLGEKIRIILSKEDFKAYKLMRHDEALSSVLTTRSSCRRCLRPCTTSGARMATRTPKRSRISGGIACSPAESRNSASRASRTSSRRSRSCWSCQSSARS